MALTWAVVSGNEREAGSCDDDDGGAGVAHPGVLSPPSRRQRAREKAEDLLVLVEEGDSERSTDK